MAEHTNQPPGQLAAPHEGNPYPQPDDPLGRPWTAQDPDPLSMAQGVNREVWGLPSQPVDDPGAELPPAIFDYSKGLLVGPDYDANAAPQVAHPGLVHRKVDVPPSYQTPHEATHRRFEPPRILPISQTAIGTLMFAQPNVGLHMVKLLALVVSLSAAGTLQFVQGSPDGTQTQPVGSTQGSAVAGGMGALSLLASTPLVLPPAELQNPWLFTAPDFALGLVTTGAGAFANGWALVAYSPYDQ